ncbi:epoxide hydrolase 4-like [Bacillus rossius redtenbacheri]|uniref:epoxide hydrolase 4-like n=1 Tax=Bacillus rossius redtenbacheri TaxID=93214 RepID=UPI002FDDB4AB
MSLKNIIIGYCFALYYGLIVCAHVFWRWLKNPSKNVFAVKERPEPPPCLLDPAYGSHCYVTVNGIKIHYVEKGDKSKPLMLFLHGFPEFWYSWRYQIKEFSKDYWTVAMDMRGYGDSDKPSGIRNYQLKYLVDDVVKVIEALGREKCVLVSHDWGGLVGWAVLQARPDRLERYVVMNAPPVSVFKELLATNKAQFRKSWYMFFYLLPILPALVLRSWDIRIFDEIFKKKISSTPQETEEDIEAFKYTFSKAGAFSGPLNYYRALMLGIGTSSLKPKPVEDPPRGLFLFGEKDDFIEIATVEMAEKSIKNLSTKIVKDANHFVQQDEPVIVNKLMRDFLNEK